MTAESTPSVDAPVTAPRAPASPAPRGCRRPRRPLATESAGRGGAGHPCCGQGPRRLHQPGAVVARERADKRIRTMVTLGVRAVYAAATACLRGENLALSHPSPDAYRHGSMEARITRARIMTGASLAMVGTFFAFDPRGRFEQLVDATRWWPVAFTILTAAVVLQAIPSRAGRVLLVGFGAAALFGFVDVPDVNLNALANLAPFLATAIGVGLVLSAVKDDRNRYVSVLWSRHVHPRRGALPDTTELVCVVGGLQFDARSATLIEGQTLRVRMFAAEVVLILPREWRCRVTSARLRGVVVRDRGPVPQTGQTLNLEITGRVGLLIVCRM